MDIPDSDLHGYNEEKRSGECADRQSNPAENGGDARDGIGNQRYIE